jgi:glycosyltransferase involved in cell wall biosynthesis|tara:strand:- start:238 stop:1410 length:1173 start_codon:yes stop_codon:yes gene_type:complete
MVNNGKIKIAIVTDRYFTSNHASVVRIKSIVKAIKKSNKFDVKIFSTREGYKKELYSSSLTFTPPPSNKNNLGFRLLTEILLGMELFLRLFINKQDLILITSPPYLMTLFCTAMARIKRVPYVVDIRDLYPDVYFSAGLLREQNVISVLLRNLEKKLYSKAFIVTTVTKKYVEHIKNNINAGNNILLLRNGYSESMVHTVEKKYDVFTLFHHGNLGKFQDVELLLKLAERFSNSDLDIDILILGSGSKDHLIQSSGLNNIKFFGQMDMKDIYNKISRAHIGLSLRTDDKVSQGAFPVKIYECIAFGIPVIVTPISEAGKFVEKYQIGYQFNPFQVDEIYSEIVDLKKNVNVLQTLSENTNTLKDEFSRKKSATNFVKELEEALQFDYNKK